VSGEDGNPGRRLLRIKWGKPQVCDASATNAVYHSIRGDSSGLPIGTLDLVVLSEWPLSCPFYHAPVGYRQFTNHTA
jgi:hypothetical protein